MLYGDETICRRKERRFKTCVGKSIRSQTIVDGSEPNDGSVIDISPSGLRLLTEGKFAVGEEFSVELFTEHSHGTYRGIVRRVEPWVAGKMVLGCQLTDTIPEEVLQELAKEGVLDRRRETRVRWNQSAKLTWELKQGDLDVQIQDCAVGGLKLISPEPIPEDKQLRIRVAECDEEVMLVDAKTVWQVEDENGCLAGVAFTKREIPEAIRSILAKNGETRFETAPKKTRQPAMRRGLTIGTVAVVILAALTQTGLPNVLATNVEMLFNNAAFAEWFGSFMR